MTTTFTTPTASGWAKRNGRFVSINISGVSVVVDGIVQGWGCNPGPGNVKIVPSRATERHVCTRHVQPCRQTGRVIHAGQMWLVEVAVAPCDVCEHADAWDARIASWKAAFPERWEASVLNVSLLRTTRPCEWAMQNGVPFGGASHPWDTAEMRRFLEGEREDPPQSTWRQLLDRERAAGGDVKGAIAAMAGLQFGA